MPKKESNIYHRNDGRWEGRFHISGTKKYKSVYGKTYSEAKEKLHKLQGENSISESKCRLSFNDIAQKWFAYEKSKVKASTLCCYKNKLDNHIMPFFSIKKYTDVSVDVVEKFKKQKLFEGFSSKYVSDMTVIIKSIAKWANKIYGYANKLSSVELPKAKRKKPDLLSEREQAVLQNYLFNRSDNTSLGILLSAFTGIRIGELCALKWNDIDLENKILHINKTVQRISAQSVTEKSKTVVNISAPKTEYSVRDIPIPEFLIEKLKSNYSSDEKYLLSGTCKLVEPRCLSYRFKSILKKVNLPSIKFHSLRHTFATNCLQQNFDIKTLSEILGHSGRFNYNENLCSFIYGKKMRLYEYAEACRINICFVSFFVCLYL